MSTMARDWSRLEVEAIVDDYLRMLEAELAGVPYNKTRHRSALLQRLNSRSPQSVEFKHANISAALIDFGFPYITGYKPRSNYQELIAEVLAERLGKADQLQQVAEADVERPAVVPEINDILSIVSPRPVIQRQLQPSRDSDRPTPRLPANYLEREARNRSLGAAGELLVVEYERARLLAAGQERLAERIEHTSRVRGDHEGYDILSFEDTGRERLIEVKTTNYGSSTPFYVTRNESNVSERFASQYHLYRLHTFRNAPRMFTLPGAIPVSCQLLPATFVAWPR